MIILLGALKEAVCKAPHIVPDMLAIIQIIISKKVITNNHTPTPEVRQSSAR